MARVGHAPSVCVPSYNASHATVLAPMGPGATSQTYIVGVQHLGGSRTFLQHGFFVVVEGDDLGLFDVWRQVDGLWAASTTRWVSDPRLVDLCLHLSQLSGPLHNQVGDGHRDSGRLGLIGDRPVAVGESDRS